MMWKWKETSNLRSYQSKASIRDRDSMFKSKGADKDWAGDMTMAAASQLPGGGCSREMYPFLCEAQKLKSST